MMGNWLQFAGSSPDFCLDKQAAGIAAPAANPSMPSSTLRLMLLKRKIMQKLILILIFIASAFSAEAQSKANQFDNNGKRDGVWKKFYKYREVYHFYNSLHSLPIFH